MVLDRPLSQKSVIISFFSDFFNNEINSVYWFVYMLIGLYLLTPILSKWLNYCKNIQIEYFLLIWIFSLFTNLFQFLDTSFNLGYFSGYIGYFVLGYYFSIKKIDKTNSLGLSIFLIMFVSIITIMGNYIFESISFESYLTPNIMILSTGIFLLAKNFNLPKNFIIRKVILKTSKFSFSIYLIHAVFISILYRIFGVNCLFISPYIGSILICIIVLICSLIFLELFRRLPFTKYISGL